MTRVTARFSSKRRAKSTPTAPVDPAVAAWVTQGEDVSQDIPWRDAKAEKRPRWWWAVRVVVVIAVGIIVLVVVARIVNPPAAAPVQSVAVKVFPDADARALAEQYVEAFYSWDAAVPEARQKALSRVLEGAGGGVGWDGKGHQVASNARVTAVAVGEEDAVAQVTVVFQVLTADEAGAWLPGEWRQAVVPVSVVQESTVPAIAGLPGLVPLTSPAESTVQEPDRDDDLAASTQEYAEAFFAAFAAKEDLAAEGAPGSRIRGLAGAVALERVESWKVWASSGKTREATAVVIWLSGGSQITNEYTVTLTETTGGGESSWLISDIHGTTN